MSCAAVEGWDTTIRMPLDSPGEECLSHILGMACSPEVSGVAAGAWSLTDWDTPLLVSRSAFIPSGLRNVSRILTDSAGRNIISSARARISAGRRGEGKTLMSLCSSRVGQHSTRYTSYTYSSKHKRNHAAPALLGCRFKHNEGAHPNSWQPCSSNCRIEGGGGSARQYITRPPRKQKKRWRSPTKNGRSNSGEGEG